MPPTTSFIRRFVNELPQGVPFTTSDCLKFGPRGAVDQALFRLVNSGYIIRVARGVFVRGDSETSLPSAQEIAHAKALAFGRKIFPHGKDIAAGLKLIASGNKRITFLVHSRSTSFDSIHGRIYLTGTTPRRTTEKKGRVTEAIQALWHIGKRGLVPEAIELATMGFTRQEREELQRSGGTVPEWLASRICKVHRWPGISLPDSYIAKQA